MFKISLKAVCAALVVMVAATTDVQAHGAVVGTDTCVLNIGPYKMKFSGYQEESGATNKYCDDVPGVGSTIAVLDFIDGSLRTMEIGVKFVEGVNIKGLPENDGETVYEIPPQIHERGTIRMEHTFKEEGYFVGIMTAKSPGGSEYIARFPFGVGKFNINNNKAYANVGTMMFLMVLVFAASGFGAFALTKKSKAQKAQRA